MTEGRITICNSVTMFVNARILFCLKLLALMSIQPVRWTGPTLGAHTQQVLMDLLGYSAETIEDLTQKGVI
jgi:crotonobetainyl-CoA:carnitine CoA-transferase CaiB-like acyl-CoA transferase